MAISTATHQSLFTPCSDGALHGYVTSQGMRPLRSSIRMKLWIRMPQELKKKKKKKKKTHFPTFSKNQKYGWEIVKIVLNCQNISKAFGMQLTFTLKTKLQKGLFSTE